MKWTFKNSFDYIRLWARKNDNERYLVVDAGTRRLVCAFYPDSSWINYCKNWEAIRTIQKLGFFEKEDSNSNITENWPFQTDRVVFKTTQLSILPQTARTVRKQYRVVNNLSSDSQYRKQGITLPPSIFCATRWVQQHELIRTYIDLQSAVVNALEIIMNIAERFNHIIWNSSTVIGNKKHLNFQY